MIFPTTVKLGLYRDEEPLKHDNYQEMVDGRKWRVAFFNSFASNIAAVLYKYVFHSFVTRSHIGLGIDRYCKIF